MYYKHFIFLSKNYKKKLIAEDQKKTTIKFKLEEIIQS